MPFCPRNYPCASIDAESACAFRKLGYSAEEAAEYIGIGEATLHELGRHGSKLYDKDFPKKVQLTPRRVVYLRPELDEWVIKRKEASQHQEVKLSGSAKSTHENSLNSSKKSARGRRA